MAPVLALDDLRRRVLFIATEKADKVKTVLVAAGLMAVLGLVPGERVFFSEHEGIDWNVIFLLLGMMVIVGVIKQTGVFDFLAIWAAKRSRGRPYRLMVMLMVITAVASPFLDNVTTIMLVAPVTLVVCHRLGIAPQPYLIAEVLASNIGGAATLIGDPPNIIIGSRAGLTFNDFLVHMAPVVVVIFVLFVVLTRVLFRADLRAHDVHLAEVMALQERRAIKDARLLVRALAVLAVVVVGFGLHSVLHVAPSIVALVGAGAMLLVTAIDVAEVLEEVEWPTLVFFMGLFVMVAGLVHTGVIGALGSAAESASATTTSSRPPRCCSGRRSSARSSTTSPTSPRWPRWSRAWPHRRLTPRPAGAVVGVRARRRLRRQRHRGRGQRQRRRARHRPRAGHPISFWQFTRYGIVVTLLSTFLAWVYVWLRYF